MSSAQDVIDGVRQLINDAGSDFIEALRWPDAELLRWLDDAQREVIKLKPEANILTRAFAVAADSPRQRLNPLTAYRLIRVETNVLGDEFGESPPIEILDIQEATATNGQGGTLSVPYTVVPSILPGQMVVVVALIAAVSGSNVDTVVFQLDGHDCGGGVGGGDFQNFALYNTLLPLTGITFSSGTVQLVTNNLPFRAAAAFTMFTLAHVNTDDPILAFNGTVLQSLAGTLSLDLSNVNAQLDQLGGQVLGPGTMVIAAVGQLQNVAPATPGIFNDPVFDPLLAQDDVYQFEAPQVATVADPVAPDVVRRELQLTTGYFLGIPTDYTLKWSHGAVLASAAVDIVLSPTEGVSRHGSVIRIAERDVMDSFTSSWTRASPRVPGVDYYKSYCMDGNDPLAFWLWPRPVANYNVFVTYVGVPEQLNSVTDTLTLSDVYLAPLIDYVCYRALLKEAREGQRPVAEKYLQSFYAALGAHRTIQTALGQNTARPPDASA